MQAVHCQRLWERMSAWPTLPTPPGMQKGCSGEACPREHNGGLAGAINDGAGRNGREEASAAHAERVLAEEAVGVAGAAGRHSDLLHSPAALFRRQQQRRQRAQLGRCSTDATDKSRCTVMCCFAPWFFILL